jgi:hypothetical protein
MAALASQRVQLGFGMTYALLDQCHKMVQEHTGSVRSRLA